MFWLRNKKCFNYASLFKGLTSQEEHWLTGRVLYLRLKGRWLKTHWRHSVLLFCFVCFVALRPKSTAMVIAGWSVHLTTLFSGQA